MPLGSHGIHLVHHRHLVRPRADADRATPAPRRSRRRHASPPTGSGDLASDRLWVAALDVTDPEQVRQTVDRAFSDLGTIDVLVNNAGYGALRLVEEVDDAEIARVIDTNLLGPIRVVRAALPHLRRQGHGRIVQVSTAGGQTTYPSFGYYHASNGAWRASPRPSPRR